MIVPYARVAVKAYLSFLGAICKDSPGRPQKSCAKSYPRGMLAGEQVACGGDDGVIQYVGVWRPIRLELDRHAHHPEGGSRAAGVL